eukprot:PRCOL_00006330-RA
MSARTCAPARAARAPARRGAVRGRLSRRRAPPRARASRGSDGGGEDDDGVDETVRFDPLTGFVEDDDEDAASDDMDELARFSMDLEAALEEAERNAAAAAEALRAAETGARASARERSSAAGPSGSGDEYESETDYESEWGSDGELGILPEASPPVDVEGEGAAGYRLYFNPFMDDLDEEFEDADADDAGAGDAGVRGEARAHKSVSVPVEELQGWEVLHHVDGVRLGVVEEVLEQSATAFLLRIGSDPCSDDQAGSESLYESTPEGARPPSSFYLPLVDDIVPVVDTDARQLHVAPPEGLLELYSGEDDMMQLMVELERFVASQFRKRRRRDAKRQRGHHEEGGGDEATAGDTKAASEQDADSEDGALPSGQRSASSALGRMPSRSALERAGRHDLVDQIDDAGGFADVAAALGMRVGRVEDGYWDDPETLDYEIGLFMADHWEEFLPFGAAEAPMWRHTLTGAVVNDEDLTEDVMAAGTADESVRHMPRRRDVLKARRWDLDHAIGLHGHYTRFALKIGRVVGGLAGRGQAELARAHANAAAEGTARARAPSEQELSEETVTHIRYASDAAGYYAELEEDPPSQARTLIGDNVEAELARADGESLLAEVSDALDAFAARNAESFAADGVMPTVAALEAAGEVRLLSGIKRLGGTRVVAAALGLRRAPRLESASIAAERSARAQERARARARARVPSSRGRGVRAGRWDDIAAVATEMRVVATSSEHQRLEDRGVYANAAGLGGDDGTGECDGDAHEHTFFMPSRAVLLAMGRSDLVWALQKHGARAVREHAGLAARPRGRPRAKDAREPPRKRGARRASAPQST